MCDLNQKLHKNIHDVYLIQVYNQHIKHQAAFVGTFSCSLISLEVATDFTPDAFPNATLPFILVRGPAPGV